ncbi:uncharacterized protein ATC70_000062 [Mucor velutinosus]|uniref:F-box domain-containing protein n=1 Tax=Mucor velutinosus TaxID=708070 RepID=A0AAN7HWT0_9FUNG|nr:hypothetical protein ATC70_000062 [Mucor velutinosus]
MDYLLPAEIITNILSYMSMTDLVRIERTCRLFQSFSLCEIEKRIIKSSDEWGILIHLGQVSAKPIGFDAKSKRAYYSVLMDPVKVKTMFDHRRPIHCSLLRKKTSKFQSYSQNGFIITVEKGMEEGKTLELDINNEACQVHAALTRLPSSVSPINTTLEASLCNGQALKKQSLQLPPIKTMAPQPLTYTLQITELSLPLSTLAA